MPYSATRSQWIIIHVAKNFQTWLLIGWQQAASQSEARFENTFDVLVSFACRVASSQKSKSQDQGAAQQSIGLILRAEPTVQSILKVNRTFRLPFRLVLIHCLRENDQNIDEIFECVLEIKCLNLEWNYIRMCFWGCDGVYHPGGYYWECYPGTISLSQVSETQLKFDHL